MLLASTLLTGCAAESRNLFFLPLDPVQVVDPAVGSEGYVTVEARSFVADIDPEFAQTRTKTAEVVFYPLPHDMIRAIVKNVSNRAIVADQVGGTPLHLECDVHEFTIVADHGVSPRRYGGKISFTLRHAERETVILGTVMRNGRHSPGRKDYQSVMHELLAKIADDVEAELPRLTGTAP